MLGLFSAMVGLCWAKKGVFIWGRACWAYVGPCWAYVEPPANEIFVRFPALATHFQKLSLNSFWDSSLKLSWASLGPLGIMLGLCWAYGRLAGVRGTQGPRIHGTFPVL